MHKVLNHLKRGEQTSTQHWRTPSSEWPSLHSCLTSYSPSSPSLPPPSVGGLGNFHSSSCSSNATLGRNLFWFAMAEALPLCRNAAFIFAGFLGPSDRQNNIVKVKQGTNLYTDDITPCSQYLPQNGKLKQKSFASLMEVGYFKTDK